jgi:hypothetical protein
MGIDVAVPLTHQLMDTFDTELRGMLLAPSHYHNLHVLLGPV